MVIKRAIRSIEHVQQAEFRKAIRLSPRSLINKEALTVGLLGGAGRSLNETEGLTRAKVASSTALARP